jgi:SpoVK/Ycf46/Vps4 family AAA+-type ATPase
MALDAVTAGQQELQEALLRLDLRLRLAVEGQRELLAERARDPFRGLHVSDADVDSLLAATPPHEIARQLLSEPASTVFPRLAWLSRRFGLNPFDQEALLVCLAPELDLSYGLLYGYLQDDVTRRRPTIDLILNLLCTDLTQRLSERDRFGAALPLLRHRLLVLADDAAAPQPLLSRPLRVDDRVVDFLLGSDTPDARIGVYADAFAPLPTADDAGYPADLQASLRQLLEGHVVPDGVGPVVYLHGTRGAAKLTVLRAACATAQRRLVVADLPALVATGTTGQSLALVEREAVLQEAVFALDGFSRLLADTPEMVSARPLVRRLLLERAGVTVLLGEGRWEPATWLPGVATISVEVPPPPPSVRLQLWRRQVDGHLPSDEVAELAARYRLDGDAIRAVTSSAQGRAAWRGGEQVSAEDFRAAARAITAPHLEGLAHRVDPRYGWEDIVLTRDGHAQLRELCARARYHEIVLEQWGFGRKHARRAGVTALFAGPPGTGKTMAAEVVAHALGLELYRIDLASTVSKYIGETEKNLERIFQAADQGDAVLLFDEADALFGKRSEVHDAHDRYANVETSYLLQRLEAYEGLAVLTTNMRGNIDEAFVRRLEFVLEFPLPEEPERLAIWRRALPAEAPLADDVDLAFLARKFKLAGGHIRNIALAAGFLAAADNGPIAMRHLVRATRREHQKIGKMIGEADFERYGGLLREN